MAIVSCTSCGAQIEDTSRFCRVCGRSFDPAELTTRKLKPTEKMTLPFGNAVMHSGDIAVVISGNDDGTSILITRGGD